MKSISLLQLARLAGVSKTTVSLILNGKSDRYKISSSTKRRVLNLAAENNYKPNILARNLSMGKSMTVGVIVPDMKDHDNSILVGAIEQELFAAGYQMVLGISGNDEEKRGKLLPEMTERKVDGVLYISRGDRMFNVTDVEIPLVSIGEFSEDHSSVTIDADAGVKKIIGYWYPRGRRTMGYVGLSKRNENVKKSFHENYIERFSMKDDRLFLLNDQFDEKKMKQHLLSIAKKGINAVFFETPLLAFQALKILKGQDMPGFEDVAVGSFGYHPSFDVVQREIIYVTKPLEKMAEEGTGLLFDLMTGKQDEIIHKKAEPLFLF